MSDESGDIIIKRGKKCPHGSHGGAWKIAFADFMTATMAFFLMLWVLGGTNDEEMKQMAEFFRNPTVIDGAPENMIQSERTNSPSNSVIDLGGQMNAPQSTEGDQPKDQESVSGSKDANDMGKGEGNGPGDGASVEQQIEQRQMVKLQAELEQKMQNDPVLSQFKDQLNVNITPSGLQIEILDNRRRPMFEPGVDLPRDYATKIMREVGRVLGKSNNKISLQGFTDASGYNNPDYTNWELSTDRANAARRALINGGLSPKQIASVVGLADTVLYDKKNPYNPSNRRISITLLTQEALDNLQALAQGGLNQNDLLKKPPQ